VLICQLRASSQPMDRWHRPNVGPDARFGASTAHPEADRTSTTRLEPIDGIATLQHGLTRSELLEICTSNRAPRRT
jgi:hypothetical protein